MKGDFAEAIDGYERALALNPDDIASIDGLAKSFEGSGDYRKAIPLLERVSAYQRGQIPDHPGQLVSLSCAHWYLDERTKALAIGRELCLGLLKRKINMAPDSAGGATFGLILHFMSVTSGDAANLEFAIDYLHKLNKNYEKRPTNYLFPKQTVKQVLGELSFEDALEGATGERTLFGAFEAAKTRRLSLVYLAIALFHDGVIKRSSGDEVGCMERMRQVYDFGYKAETRWELARKELGLLR